MTKTNSTRVTYHRIYVDAKGDSHFGTVTLEQSLARQRHPLPRSLYPKTNPLRLIGSTLLSPAGSANCTRLQPDSSLP